MIVEVGTKPSGGPSLCEVGSGRGEWCMLVDWGTKPGGTSSRLLERVEFGRGE